MLGLVLDGQAIRMRTRRAIALQESMQTENRQYGIWIGLELFLIYQELTARVAGRSITEQIDWLDQELESVLSSFRQKVLDFHPRSGYLEQDVEEFIKYIDSAKTLGPSLKFLR